MYKIKRTIKAISKNCSSVAIGMKGHLPIAIFAKGIGYTLTQGVPTEASSWIEADIDRLRMLKDLPESDIMANLSGLGKETGIFFEIPAPIFPSKTLRLDASFSKLFFATCSNLSEDETRACMLSLNVGHSYIGFTDGRRAIYRPTEAEQTGAEQNDPFSLVFPWKDLKTIWNKKETHVYYDPQKNGRIMWDLGHDIKVFTSIYDGSTPNLEKIYPYATPIQTKAPAGAFVWMKAAAKNLKKVPRTPYLVCMSVSPLGACQVHEHQDPSVINRSPLGEDLSSIDFRIGFNARYISDFLECYGEDVSIAFQGLYPETSSTLWESSNSRDRYILMPIKLKEFQKTA